MKLSIGQAWDEAKRILGADGKAIFAVALALTVLPGTIIETASPSSLRAAESPWWSSLLGLVAAMLGVTSQLAISRIALGPATTVGETLALGFRRLPALFGALLLVAVPFVAMAALLAMANGNALDPRALPPALALPMLLILLVALYVLVRLLFLTPLAADTRLGPVALLKESWRLSRGSTLRLFGLIIILMLVAVLVVGVLGGALSAAVILAFGQVASGSLSALLVALIQQLVAAVVSVLFILVVCRLYVQANDGSRAVSVPHAGGE